MFKKNFKFYLFNEYALESLFEKKKYNYYAVYSQTDSSVLLLSDVADT